MHHEPKNLHFDATMPIDASGNSIPVLVSVFICEQDGRGGLCQIQIKKKGQPGRLWAELLPAQAKLRAKRLKSVEKWAKNRRPQDGLKPQ